MNCRVLKTNNCKITQKFKKNVHNGVDLVDWSKGYGRLCDIVAHSDGEVVELVTNCNQNTNGKDGHVLKKIYGNYIKLKHYGGYYTLYAHLKYGSVKVKKGDKVKKGQVIGYMGNTGYSSGGHLHFEVRNAKNQYLDAGKYLENDLPEVYQGVKHNFKLGDIVKINGVYISSNSTKKLKPLIKEGMITKIVEGAHNPYLLNKGLIGWVNDSCIVYKELDFKINDCVVPTKLVDVNGIKLVQYDKEYYIKKIENETASLYAKRNGKYYLWAVLPFSNIKRK